MPPQPGTYALIFSAARNGQIAIGKIGTLQLQPGFYIYSNIDGHARIHCQKFESNFL
jgi:hypothetical protein